MPEICLIFGRKNYQLSKCPNFYDICPKMPKFYMIIARKCYSHFFLGGGHPLPSRLLRLSVSIALFSKLKLTLALSSNN